MKFKGLLAGSVSLNGYSPDLLKSGIQKYSRRGELTKSEWCAVELDLFSECGGEPIRTNNINRLIVICCEDIGVAEATLPIYIGRLVRHWDKHRTSGNGEDRLALLKMVKMINDSPKIRILSDIRAVYGHAISHKQITEDPQFQDIYENISELPDEAAGIWEMSLEKDTEELLPLMDGLVYHLDMQDDRVFYYMFRILKLHEEKKRCSQRFRGWKPSSYPVEKTFGGRFQPEYAIWQHLFTRAQDEGESKLIQSLEVLFDWYNHRSENWLYLAQAILYFIRDFDWSKILFEPTITPEEVSVIYQKNYQEKLTLDDYIYDKHTAIGRKNGANQLDFAHEGSKVYNEASDLVNNKYRTIYNLIKEISQSQAKTTKKGTRKSTKSTKNSKDKGTDEVIMELVEDPIPL